MKQANRYLAFLLALLMALTLCACGDSGETQPETTTQAETVPAPDFTVVDANGNPVKLSDWKGKPVVVNFWASWCPPCKAEMPDFQAVYEELGDQVIFMIINVTDGANETLESAKKHIADNGYTFPVYFDTQLLAANAYYVSSIPMTFFVDKEGNLVTYAKGMIDAQTLRRAIRLISE